MRRLSAPRAVCVCAGVCLAMGLVLVAASGAMAATLSLCVPNAENRPTKTPTKTGCEKNYVLVTLNVEGKEGKQGPTGPTGLKGTRGPAGVTGATGATGLNGATGPTGVTGATGATGLNGKNGIGISIVGP